MAPITARVSHATEVADHRGTYGPGTGWVAPADPEGNEFCILRSQAERAGTTECDLHVIHIWPETPPHLAGSAAIGSSPVPPC
ncbi:MAG: hypothetical protein ACRCY9_04090 [Phycicoccus sp.]